MNIFKIFTKEQIRIIKLICRLFEASNIWIGGEEVDLPKKKVD
jgi:hypothetical protein